MQPVLVLITTTTSELIVLMVNVLDSFDDLTTPYDHNALLRDAEAMI